MKKNYELAYLISSQNPEEIAQKISQEINDFIEKEQGIITESQLPQKINLAYQIEKQSFAWFQLTYFSLDSSRLKSLEKRLKEEKEILLICSPVFP